MKDFKLNTSQNVKTVFDNYPGTVKDKMLNLRELILETAKETEEVLELEETLKWGEPSYIAKHGSTLRIDWKKKTPNQYAMYFNCSSQLVATFRIVFKQTFDFEGNRALVFQINEPLPKMS
ncbi:DUF1801 domain-containing protein [Aquimarina spongiae]|uniref:YdhG-like domain-containing protein n=1 Tax=Aquimarina spongiae TaxID=570521 RepID=A0A1M6AKT6_9FLAO|nr:DUF1801 domain-containing protein [Aquimarina spongiae]SHI37129.1 protein of unknown function (DU1801) [Aquimarina spongiae]